MSVYRGGARVSRNAHLRVARADAREQLVERGARHAVGVRDARDELRQHAEPRVERDRGGRRVAEQVGDLGADAGHGRVAEPDVEQVEQVLLHRRRRLALAQRDRAHERARGRHEPRAHARVVLADRDGDGGRRFLVVKRWILM